MAANDVVMRALLLIMPNHPAYIKPSFRLSTPIPFSRSSPQPAAGPPAKMAKLRSHSPWLLLSCVATLLALSSGQSQQVNPVDVEYHMGPVLSSPVDLYAIWYGSWDRTQRAIIKAFLGSLSSSSSSSSPSVADWWRTVQLYTDQSDSNITASLALAGEFHDTGCSRGRYLTRMAIQSVIKNAVNSSHPEGLPLNPYNGLYMVFTSADVLVQDFCRASCGFHYFTFPKVVGATVPYLWVGDSGTQCPGMCAYPFAPPQKGGGAVPGSSVMGAPNGDVGADGMISVIAHELAETCSNPLVNAWYAGEDPTAPTEIADLCLGVYGTGGGGGYAGQVYRDERGKGYNVNGAEGRRFMVQWVWNPASRSCYGPNARR